MAKVFVADDNPHVHRMVEEILGVEGHAVTGVVDGSEALEQLTSVKPDVALLDATLPGADASDICAAIFAQHDLDHIRIVMLAGPLEAIDEGEPLPPGIHSIVQKPLDTTSLLDLVRDLPAAERGSDEASDAGTQQLVVDTLVNEALRHANSSPSREAIREQIEAVVMASMPAIIDRITDRLTDRLKNS